MIAFAPKALFILSKPLSWAAKAVLDQALSQAGWMPHEYQTQEDPNAAGPDRSQFACVIVFGDGAAAACLPDWKPGSASDRRGYVWQAAGYKVLSTLDPERCKWNVDSYGGDASGINAMLLAADLERGRREAQHAGVRRANRSISVVDRPAAWVVDRIRRHGIVACDIECSDPSTLLCIGFAISPTEAYVFVGEALDAALEICADPGVRKVFQNGQFDCYFLATRRGCRVAGWTDDCMIAWHALWPEIAGKGKKGSKRTKKSLAFLASLYTESPEWWKEYDTDEAGMYELNGRDCCITFEIMAGLQREIQDMGVEAIYRHEMSMMPVLVAIQERGLAVDEAGRQAAIAELEQRKQAAESSIKALATPLLADRRAQISRPHLFYGTERCKCCNGGAKKAAACWSCAGYDKAPSKRQLEKDAIVLAECDACRGAGRFETFDFNPASTQQQIELFNHVLGLPKHYRDGRVTVDEKSLKQMLAGVLN